MVFTDSLINGDIYISPRLTPVAMATKFGGKNGYNLACVRDFCAYRGVLGDEPSNAANCIFP